MVAVRSAGASLRAEVIAAGSGWSTSLRRLVRLVAVLDISDEWRLDSAPTCAHWVAAALDVEVCTAREWVRIGRALARLRVIDDAFERDLLSYSKVRTLTRVANAKNEGELCELAQQVPAGRLAHALAAWQLRRETPNDTDRRQRKARFLTWRVAPDGMVAGSFRLAPGEATKITTPIDAQILRTKPTKPEPPADAPAGLHMKWPTIGQQRVDALVALVEGGGAANITEIVMHVRADGCTLDDGTPIAGTVLERIAPTAFLRALIHDAESRPINASGRQRHPTTRQRRVVKARDEMCVDCATTEFLQYDHEPEYEVTRRTLVDEIRLRCWTCHRARHERIKKTARAIGSASVAVTEPLLLRE
jgi:hypothetical protein